MNKLANILRKTAAKEVHVKLAQVIELIGEDKALELSRFQVGKTEARVGRVGPRSVIPPEKRVDNNVLACYNKDELLAAILEEQGEDFQDDGKQPEWNAAPNPEITPDSHQTYLEERGLV